MNILGILAPMTVDVIILLMWLGKIRLKLDEINNKLDQLIGDDDEDE